MRVRTFLIPLFAALFAPLILCAIVLSSFPDRFFGFAPAGMGSLPRRCR
jgi:hypothetical protein